jgi:hypothetical protein
MKPNYLLILLLLGNPTFSQDVALRKTIDSTVHRIQACPNHVSTFTKVETINGNEIPIKYQLKTCKGFGTYIERIFSNKDSVVYQQFYEWDYELIYSIERIVNYYARDSITWRAIYYFSDGKLRDHETLGHGKSEMDSWDPEQEVIANYRRARNDIRGFLQK